MIERFRVQNYKALKDVTLDLTPIHVLIGPNDSGKTSILEAIAALSRSADHSLDLAFAGSWSGRNLVWTKAAEPVIDFEARLTEDDDKISYNLSCRFALTGRSAVIAQEEINDDVFPIRNHNQTSVFRSNNVIWSGKATQQPVAASVHKLLTGVHYYRWVPKLLGLPNAPDSRRRFRMESNGFGLALCLDDILGDDRDAFLQLETSFRQFFPHIKAIKLLPQPAFKSRPDNAEQIPTFDRSDGKGLSFHLVSGDVISAAQVSDGVLLVLAYLAILHLPEPPRLLLIEEPENGIHPRRLSEVLSVLRKLIGAQTTTQVILTTHSPYVVDLFRPEEVTLCRKQEDGSIAVRRLSESETVRRQIDVFTLGEIWTAEGDEALAAPITEPVGSAA